MMKCCLSCKTGWDNPDCNLCKDNLNINYVSGEICYLVECGLETISEDCKFCRLKSEQATTMKRSVEYSRKDIEQAIE